MQVITSIVNKSFSDGNFPTCLKISKICPLFKKGDKTAIENYRPISQLSTFSKIIESVAMNQLTDYLEENKILSETQFGFRAKHSTQHCLLAIKHELEMAKNNKQFTILVSLDLSKAFDIISNNILMEKLGFYGCSLKAQNWFRSFFEYRQQIVSWNGKNSNSTDLHNISVVQGSTCGPKMFSMYTNDLPNASTLKTYSFADDCTLMISGLNLKELEKELNEQLSYISDYYKANKLSLNVSKSTYMVIKPQKKALDSSLNIKIGNETLQKTNCIKFLGVYFDDELNFNIHLEHVKSKLQKAIGALCMTRNILTYKAKLLIYHSLFHSHLNYCPLVWMTSLNSSKVKELFMLQKKAVRLVFNVKPSHHTAKLFELSKIIKFDQVVEYNSYLFIQKHVLGQQPQIFYKFLPLNEIKTRSKIIYPKSLYNANTFHKILKIWLNGPNSIKETLTVPSLKIQSKHFILSNAQKYQCNTVNCTKCKLFDEKRIISYMNK